MATLQLTRKDMAELLLSLKGEKEKSPLEILQEAWLKGNQGDIQEGKKVAAFVSTSLSPILEKIIKTDKKDAGFSINDIVALGNHIEYTNYSTSAVQNWVKRDVKELIGPPQNGKKYSVDQAAMIFIIEDLKTALDFQSIRKLLKLIFNNPEDITDDLITPSRLYEAYSSLFEELDIDGDQILDLNNNGKIDIKKDKIIETLIEKRADAFAYGLDELNNDQKEAIGNTIVIAVLSVQTSYFHSLAKHYMNATLFLQNIRR